ncbi:MAG: RNA polymerase sigma-70 factor [Bacteroidota bacterium]
MQEQREHTSNPEVTVELSREKQIVLKVIEGNHEAFAQLYDMYAERIYYFALRFMISKEDAENITQEVFVKVWETRDRLDVNLSLSSYLFTIAKNTIFNIHRKRVNELAYLEHLGNYLELNQVRLENEIIFRDIQDHLEKLINELPPQRKKVFELSRKHGLSHKEIADQLNISEKTIETHIRLALKTLRDGLDR